ncbi:MAG: 23S rRNA (guanosine(2251)-2'-O)-methyltransferase RlmB [Spirochaetes bacterium]|nr:23S rRNA (guanosine(2251)-2'-O)-methyltransferase RlmB [Spirochaetota bacterium]
MNEPKYIYGINPVKEYLKTVKSGTLYIKKNIKNIKINELIKKAKDKKLEISYLDDKKFNRQFDVLNNQGIVLKINEEYSNLIDEAKFLNLLDSDSRISNIIILDGIKDPGNLGAVLRSALLFNVDFVVLPKDNSCPINETVVKRSSGASSYLNITYVTNITRIINALKARGFWIYASDLNGENINKINFREKTVIIMGEENKGIRPLVKKNSDFIITIPTNNKIDSLNLSVSAGIFLYELFKSR